MLIITSTKTQWELLRFDTIKTITCALIGGSLCTQTNETPIQRCPPSKRLAKIGPTNKFEKGLTQLHFQLITTYIRFY